MTTTNEEEKHIDFETALNEGIQLFNGGEYFEAHEIWEEAWIDSQMDDRHLLQGLIQVAAGFYKLKIGQPAGTAKLLEKSLTHLTHLPMTIHSLELQPLIESVKTWQASSKKMVETWSTHFNAEEIPKIKRNLM